MAKDQRRKGETIAAERKRLRTTKRQDTVAGRAPKRRNVGARTRRGR